MTLLNKDVENFEASAAVYHVDTEKKIFTFDSNAPALAYGGEGLLKKTFQSVHKGEASLSDQQKFLKAYNAQDLESFQSTLRTVGVGTNIILHESATGSIMVPMVGRTDTGPDGTVGLGKQSRAAGGAHGDLSLSGLRELHEEFIFARDERDGSVVVLNIDYLEASLNPLAAQGLKDLKNAQALRILGEYGLSYTDVRFQDVHAEVLDVPGLTENITQVVDGEETIVRNRVLTDNPAAGDFAGVDTILYVNLPRDLTIDSTFVKDGEESFDGDLLKRDWSMKSAQEWCDLVASGMPISPAPKRVFDNWDKVETALKLNI